MISRIMKWGFVLTQVCCLLLCFSIESPLSAQLTTGTISGTVKDSSDAVLPGVAVKVTNLETATSRTAVTGSRGEYRIVSLSAGSYQIEASITGFQTDVRTGIQLSVGRDAVVDFTLKVGNATERITVTGEAPLIETTTATVSGLVDPKQMRDMPLNGRSFLELVPLQAGAVVAQAGAQVGSHGFGQKISISGTRYISNVFLLDGAVMNDFFGSASSATGGVAGIETVREFRVITNAYDAEYGRHTGGVISAITKSGTNQFHGTLFEFLRNDNLDASKWEDNRAAGAKKPEFHRNQFGTALGGPIIRDKTFFFGSYEGLREAVGLTRTFNVPGLGMRKGFVPLTQSNCPVPLTAEGCFIGASPKIQPYLEAYPIPNNPDRADGTAQFVNSPSQITDDNSWMVRGDHSFSNSDSVFARLSADSAERQIPASGGFNTTEVDSTLNRFLTLEETHIFSPALLGSTNFSFSRTKNRATDLATEGFTFPRFAFGGIADVPGRITVTGLSGWGGTNTNPKIFAQNLFQFKEDLFLSSGRHSLKFGLHGERIQYNLRSDINAGGTFAFTNLQNFLTGNVSSGTFVSPGSDNIRGWRENLVGLYIQDDFALRPGLSLNFGVRYEFIKTPTEVNGKVADIRDLSPAHLYTVKPNQTDVGDPFFLNPSLKNFGPRVGFAWTPFRNGKTSLRGGFGIFHEQILPAYFILGGVREAPFYSIAELSSNTITIDFPNAYDTQVSRGVTGGALPQIDGWQYNISQPAVYKWSLEVQQQIGSEMTVTTGYSASRGTHLMRGSQSVNSTPTELRNGKPFLLIQAPLPSPFWGRMRFPQFDGTSDYHSLQMSAEKRFGRGLQIHSSYTFSKSTDDSSTVQGGTDYGEADRGSYLFQKEHGRAGYDVRNSFSTNFVYDLPAGNGGGLMSHLLGGWGIAGLIRLSSGNPMNPSATRPRLGSTQIQNVAGSTLDLIPGGDQNPVSPQNPDHYFDSSQFAYPATNCLPTVTGPSATCDSSKAPGTFFGNLGRNVMTTPGIATMDFTLTKGTRLRENLTTQFRAEFFNLLNRPNFGVPSATIFDQNGVLTSTVGQITSTRTSSRQIQFALKFLF